jgi:GNAT superfamily N-acetyltransferase
MATITGINWIHCRAAIGYWILPRHRGHGFAKAAVSLLPDLARELGLVRIQALIDRQPRLPSCPPRRGVHRRSALGMRTPIEHEMLHPTGQTVA